MSLLSISAVRRPSSELLKEWDRLKEEGYAMTVMRRLCKLTDTKLMSILSRDARSSDPSQLVPCPACIIETGESFALGAAHQLRSTDCPCRCFGACFSCYGMGTCNRGGKWVCKPKQAGKAAGGGKCNRCMSVDIAPILATPRHAAAAGGSYGTGCLLNKGALGWDFLFMLAFFLYRRRGKTVKLLFGHREAFGAAVQATKKRAAQGAGGHAGAGGVQPLHLGIVGGRPTGGVQHPRLHRPRVPAQGRGGLAAIGGGQGGGAAGVPPGGLAAAVGWRGWECVGLDWDGGGGSGSFRRSFDFVFDWLLSHGFGRATKEEME